MAETNYTPVDMGWGNPTKTGTATPSGGGAMPGTTTAGGAFNPYATRQASPGHRMGMRPGYGMGMGGGRGWGQRNPWASMGLPPWLGMLGQLFGGMGGYGGKGLNPWGHFQPGQGPGYGGPRDTWELRPGEGSSGGYGSGGGKSYQDYQRMLASSKFQGQPPSYEQWAGGGNTQSSQNPWSPSNPEGGRDMAGSSSAGGSNFWVGDDGKKHYFFY